jgi:hypothetical protein
VGIKIFFLVSVFSDALPAGERLDGSDAMRRAIGAANFHPLSVPALTRQAIKRLQRTAAPASKLACSSAADPQRR